MIFQHCPRPGAYSKTSADYVTHSQPHPEDAELRIPRLMNAMSKAYEEAGKGHIDLTKLPIEKQRLLAHLAETTIAHHRSAVAANAGSLLLKMGPGVSTQLGLKETVTTADIATFTSQQLAFIVDTFAPIVFDEVVTTVGMLGPTAYIHTQTYKRADADGFYGANSNLVDGLDPSYSECPAECEASNGIDIEVTSDIVEAECRRLHGEYCIPANYHYGSQYGGNLADVLMQGIGIELRRAIQAWMLALIYGSAAETYTWNRTPAAGSVWETLNIKEWYQELWSTIRAANRDIMNAPTGRVSANNIIGDVEGIGVLEDTVNIQYRDEQPTELTRAFGDEATSFFGITKPGRFKVWRFLEGMPANVLVLLDRNDSDPTVVYAPWIPITSLGMLTDPKLAKVTLGAIALQGQTVLRPSRIRRINIGD